MIIADREGRVLSHSKASEVGRLLTDGPAKRTLQISDVYLQEIKTQTYGTVYDIAAPVFAQSGFAAALDEQSGPASEKVRIGVVRIGVSLKGLQKELGSLFFVGTIITGSIITLGIIVSIFFVRLIIRPIEGMVSAAVKIADGDLTQQIQFSSDDEVGLLSDTFNRMSDNLGQMVKRVQDVADHVSTAAAKLIRHSHLMLTGVEDQIRLSEASAGSVEKFNQAIQQIAEGTEILASSAEETSSSILEMSSSITEVAHHTSGLATSVEDTSSSIMQMSASIKQVAENVHILSSASLDTASALSEINTTVREVETNAKASAELSEKVSKDARELGMPSIEKTIAGMNKIQETVLRSADVINRLGERSEQVGKILTVIDEITKQTNLLALNAAILAAQAGEQGKGFSVVADEIKNLADRTGASTKEIGELIGNVQGEARDAVESIRDGARSVEEGVGLSLEARDTLKTILDTAARSATMSWQIEKAAVEQARGVRQINEAMDRVSAMAQQISKAIQEQSRGTEQIMHASAKMRDMTRQVNISTEEQAKGSRQITKAVENVTERVQQIAKAINEQKNGTVAIFRSVEESRNTSRDCMAVVTEIDKTVQELSKQAESLKESIGRFKVNR